jgi:hypothetical protein
MMGLVQDGKVCGEGTGSRATQNYSPNRDEPEGKQVRMMTDEGRDIVDPNYSKGLAAGLLTQQASPS